MEGEEDFFVVENNRRRIFLSAKANLIKLFGGIYRVRVKQRTYFPRWKCPFLASYPDLT
jgi:hypothetical protein